MPFPPFLTLLRSNANNTMTVPTDVPIGEVTFAEATEWMNSPASFADRLERRFLLKQYIGASLNLKQMPEVSPKG